MKKNNMISENKNNIKRIPAVFILMAISLLGFLGCEVVEDPAPKIVMQARFDPQPGSFFTGEELRLISPASGSRIYYSLNGTDPDETAILYTSPILLDRSYTVKTIVYHDDYETLGLVSGDYVVRTGDPVLSVSGGSYELTQEITLSCSSPGAEFYYTTDGSQPDTDSEKYQDSIILGDSALLKVIALAEGCLPSPPVTAEFQISSVAAPFFLLDSGTYHNRKNFKIGCYTTGAEIRYSLDGTDPGPESTLYTGSLYLDSDTTVKALAFKDGLAASEIVTAVYEFAPASPVLSVESGTFSKEFTVTLSSSTTGSSIYYTTDGSVPDETSTQGTSILIDRPIRVRAIALSNSYDWPQSDEIDVMYHFQTAPPVFSLLEDTYPGQRNLTLSCSSPDSSIRYTLDGSEPDESSTLYESVITIDSSLTVKARAFHDNWNNSTTVEATYRIWSKDLLAGSGIAGSANGTGDQASFRSLSDIARGPQGNLFITDKDNHVIRKVSPSGETVTYVGSGIAGYNDNTGILGHYNSAQPVSFNLPGAVALGADGSVYVGDSGNFRIRKIVEDSGDILVSTLAGSGNNNVLSGTGTEAEFYEIKDMTMAPDGTLLVLHRSIEFASYTWLARIDTETGEVTNQCLDLYNPFIESLTSSEGGSISSICTDSEGNIYVGYSVQVSYYNRFFGILKVDEDYVQTLFYEKAGYTCFISGMDFGQDGNLYMAVNGYDPFDRWGNIFEFRIDTLAYRVMSGGDFNTLGPLLADPDTDRLYVADVIEPALRFLEW